MKRDGPKEPTAIHGPFGITFHPLQKPNTTADCLENQFTPHDLCEENHKRQAEARVQALLKAVDNNRKNKTMLPTEISKLPEMASQTNASGTVQELWYT
jgi:hypothetical protein